MNQVATIIECIKNQQSECEGLNQPLPLNEYYTVLKTILHHSIDSKLVTQARYCAMYLMALVESNPSESLEIDKDTYETAIYTVSKGNNHYKYFVYKNLAISFAIFALISGMLFGVFHFDFFLSFGFALIVLLLDLYANGKTNQIRYQRKLVRLFEKEVNPVLIKVTQNRNN